MLAFYISATRCNLNSSSREMQYEPGAAIKSTAIERAFSYHTIIVTDQTSGWQIFNRWIIRLSSAVISYTTRNVVSSTTSRSRSCSYCRLRLSVNICSSWLIRDNTLSFGRDKYWIPSKKRGDGVCTLRVYIAQMILHICVSYVLTLSSTILLLIRDRALFTPRRT